MRTAECELLFAAPLAAITGPPCLGMVVAAGRATGCKFLTALLATATGSGTDTVVVGWAARALLCSTAAAACSATGPGPGAMVSGSGLLSGLLNVNCTFLLRSPPPTGRPGHCGGGPLAGCWQDSKTQLKDAACR